MLILLSNRFDFATNGGKYGFYFSRDRQEEISYNDDSNGNATHDINGNHGAYNHENGEQYEEKNEGNNANDRNESRYDIQHRISPFVFLLLKINLIW